MSDRPTVAIAADHAGFELKEKLRAHLAGRAEVIDLGPPNTDRVDYPDYAAAVAKAVQAGRAQYGVLVCGSGQGMCIAANKHEGIRAALVHDEETARLARAHNDAQIVCVGQRLTDARTAEAAVDAFLATPFEGGRHAERVRKIHAAER